MTTHLTDADILATVNSVIRTYGYAGCAAYLSTATLFIATFKQDDDAVSASELLKLCKVCTSWTCTKVVTYERWLCATYTVHTPKEREVVLFIGTPDGEE